jgi:hypothetical protein
MTDLFKDDAEPMLPKTGSVDSHTWLPESRANLPPMADARLPANYETAKLALAECSRVDECQDWADKMAAMTSYAKQADDPELAKMCRRIQARALERCGELLKQIPDAKRGPKLTDGADTELSALVGRMQSARAAGLSERQTVTALRVANVPKGEFERRVESDNPPTVTALADQGKKPTLRPLVDLGDRTPEEFKAATALLGMADRIGRVAQCLDIAQAVRGLSPPERQRVIRDVASAQNWLNSIAAALAPASKVPASTDQVEDAAAIDAEPEGFVCERPRGCGYTDCKTENRCLYAKPKPVVIRPIYPDAVLAEQERGQDIEATSCQREGRLLLAH